MTLGRAGVSMTRNARRGQNSVENRYSDTPHRNTQQSRAPRQVVKKITKTRGKRGFGGHWRAYVRANSLGKRGTPNLKLLAVDYNAEKKQGSLDGGSVARAGKAATIVGRLHPPKAGQSAFGPTGRIAKQRGSLDFRRSLVAAATGDDSAQTALALADSLAAAGTNLAMCVSTAKAAMALRTKQQKDRAEKLQESLSAFRMGAGAKLVQGFVEAIEGLPPGMTLVPVPSPGGSCIEVVPAKADDLAHGVAWAYQSKQANASGALRKYWADSHQAVPEGSAEGAAATEKTTSECYKAGRCLCTNEGKELRRLRNNFLKALKKACPPNSAERKALASGDIVARLSEGPWSAAADAVAQVAGPTKDIFLHVGLMYFNPFRPTFLEMALVECAETGSEEQRRLLVKVCQLA